MSTVNLKKTSPAPKIKFAGVSLAGGKTSKTAVSVLEYYPRQERLFVRSVYPELGASHEEESADQGLYKLLMTQEKRLKYVAVDAPLQFPKCVRCDLKCPGYERCKEPEMVWMWRHFRKLKQTKKKPHKIFTPYTERCVDTFLTSQLREQFHSDHALGANRAPLAARAHFLQRRMPRLPMIEFFPRLSLWRIGTELGVQKSYLKFYRHSQGSDEGRLFFLSKLIEQGWLFMYQQDLRLAVEEPQVFESILGGMTGYLKYRGQTVRPPLDFPLGEVWVEYPAPGLEWYPRTVKTRSAL